tara:strand:+ start:5032 stop:6033 length:1002 start_codon:yes stop_codon:yes gene_type:complete
MPVLTLSDDLALARRDESLQSSAEFFTDHQNVISVSLYLTFPDLVFFATVGNDVYNIINRDEHLLERMYAFVIPSRNSMGNIMCLSKLNDLLKFKKSHVANGGSVIRIPHLPLGFYRCFGEVAFPIGTGYRVILRADADPTYNNPIEAHIGFVPVQQELRECRFLGTKLHTRPIRSPILWHINIKKGFDMVCDVRISRTIPCHATLNIIIYDNFRDSNGLSICAPSISIPGIEKGYHQIFPNTEKIATFFVCPEFAGSDQEFYFFEPNHCGFQPTISTNGPISMTFAGVLKARPDICDYRYTHCNTVVDSRMYLEKKVYSFQHPGSSLLMIEP